MSKGEVARGGGGATDLIIAVDIATGHFLFHGYEAEEVGWGTAVVVGGVWVVSVGGRGDGFGSGCGYEGCFAFIVDLILLYVLNLRGCCGSEYTESVAGCPEETGLACFGRVAVDACTAWISRGDCRCDCIFMVGDVVGHLL